MLPPLNFKTGSETIVLDDGTVVLNGLDGEEDAPTPPAGAPVQNDVVSFEETDTAPLRKLAMRSFGSLWSEEWTFFAPNVTRTFHGTMKYAGGENSMLARSLRLGLQFAAAQSGRASSGSYNTFTLLSEEETNTFFDTIDPGMETFFSGPVTRPAKRNADVRRRVGVRRSLSPDSNASYIEAYTTLASACAGFAPAVHVAGIVDGRSVFVMDAHTPLSELMASRSIGGVRLPPRPSVPGLDGAIGALFAKVAKSGLLMLDSKPANIVVDLAGDAPTAFAIDYDELFCSYKPKADSACVFVVNATMFLLSMPQRCIKEGEGDIKAMLFSYRPIVDLKQRLRRALGALRTEDLCVALNEHLFHNRLHPSRVSLHTVDTDRLSRLVIFLANHYANFDGGSHLQVSCPIDGLKFDAPIWPQLVRHVMGMHATPVGDEDLADDLRRASLAPAKSEE